MRILQNANINRVTVTLEDYCKFIKFCAGFIFADFAVLKDPQKLIPQNSDFRHTPMS